MLLVLLIGSDSVCVFEVQVKRRVTSEMIFNSEGPAVLLLESFIMGVDTMIELKRNVTMNRMII
jgi:hypothetical protein